VKGDDVRSIFIRDAFEVAVFGENVGARELDVGRFRRFEVSDSRSSLLDLV
jgi:hypothetical protein